MVLTDPDQVGAVDSDGISTPDVLWVQLGDVDVLDDDVFCALCDVETLPTEDALVAHTDDGLVGADGETCNAGLVVGDLDGRRARAGVTIGAPACMVDGVLATISGALVRCRPAAVFGGGAFSTLEVEFLVEDNAAGGAVGQP